MDILPATPEFFDATIVMSLTPLLSKPAIGRADVAALRASALAFGLRSAAEAEMMFAVERNPSEKCREWGDLLVECVTDYMVWGERPTGSVTEERALWLSDQVGETPTPACMALLISIIDEAQDLPAWFLPAVRLRAAKVFGQREGKPMLRAA